MNPTFRKSILVTSLFLVSISLLILCGFWYLRKESIVFQKFDEDRQFWLVSTCKLNESWTSYETFVSVQSEDKHLTLVKTYIDANDLFSDCLDGNSAIADLSLTDDAGAIEVVFRNKERMLYPVFLKFKTGRGYHGGSN